VSARFENIFQQVCENDLVFDYGNLHGMAFKTGMQTTVQNRFSAIQLLPVIKT
jgi:hypothetical protein